MIGYSGHEWSSPLELGICVSSSKIDTWNRDIYDQGDKDVRVATCGVECTELGGKVCKNKRFMDV